MIEPTQQEQASEILTETEEVFDYSATETAETKSLPKSVVSKQEFSLMWMPERFWLEKMH